MVVTKVDFELYNKLEIHDTAGALIGRSEIQGEDDHEIYISSPIGLDGMKVLEVGQRIKAVYYHKQRAYQFKTKVINRFVKQIKIFVLQKPESYEVIQRREAVRVDISRPIRYAVITEEEKDFIIKTNIPAEAVKSEFDIRFIDARTFDISAGGIGVILEANAVNPGDYLLVIIDLEGREELMIMQVVKVARSGDFKESDASSARKVGIKLVQGGKGIEERIFQYLFKVMREQSSLKSKEDE